ncbi:MAG: hypothetical protein ACE15C_17220 [Phycisphaerae bacterium]
MKLLGAFTLALAAVVVIGVGAVGDTGAKPAAIASGKARDSAPAEIAAAGPLPEGGNGIAAKYPGDAKIAGDPAVILADDFEDYTRASDLGKRWDNVFQKQYVTLATTQANVFRGRQSLEFTLPRQEAELGDAVEKILKAERDVLFLRYYSKYESPYDVVGSSHNGASISAHYNDSKGRATPGIPADGVNKFLANLETWRGEATTPSPGYLNIYIYHPGQRSQWGDHFFPTGQVMPNTSLAFDFGPTFVKRPDVMPKLDRWYCYEFMVKANTPGTAGGKGKSDGRIAVWVDGKLVADFPRLRLRDVETLRIDRFGLCFHIKSNPKGVSRKWYDNVVAATSYIGPVAQ